MYYLHKLDTPTRRTYISIDHEAIPAPTYVYLNDAPIINAEGGRVPNKIGWTLGPIETETEAKTLALAIAERYGWDVMIDGKPAGLPYLGKPGEWPTSSDAARALGSIKSDRKAAAVRENGKKGGRPRKESKAKSTTTD